MGDQEQTSCSMSEMSSLKMQEIITVNSIMNYHEHSDSEPYKNPFSERGTTPSVKEELKETHTAHILDCDWTLF